MPIPMGSSLLFSGLILSSEGSDSAKAFNVSKERAATKKNYIFYNISHGFASAYGIKAEFTNIL